MEYFWWLFLATRLDGISSFFGWMTFFSALTVLISWVCILVGYGIIETMMEGTQKWEAKQVEDMREFRTKMYPWRKWALVLFVVFSFLWALTPSKRDAMFIAGGVGVVEGVKALKDSSVAKQSVAIVEQWLENNLNELRDKAKERQR